MQLEVQWMRIIKLDFCLCYFILFCCQLCNFKKKEKKLAKETFKKSSGICAKIEFQKIKKIEYIICNI